MSFGDGIMDFAFGGLSAAKDLYVSEQDRKAEERRRQQELDAAKSLAMWDAGNKKAIYQAIALAVVGGLGLVVFLKRKKRG